MGRTKRKYRLSDQGPKKLSFVLPTVKLGTFTAANICLQEAAINNVVLRVEMESKVLRPTISRAKKISPGQQDNTMSKKPHQSYGNNVLHIRRKNRPAAVEKMHAASPKPKGRPRGRAKILRKVVGNLRKQDSAIVSKNQPTVQEKKTRTPKTVVIKPFRHKAIKDTDSEEHDLQLVGKPKKQKMYCLQYRKTKSAKEPATCHFNWELLDFPEKLCQLTLPSPTWCVNLVRTNAHMPVSFSVLNKNQQRGVVFNRKHDLFNIIIGGKSTKLLACPSFVYTIQDLEILVRIVNNLPLDDCMVLQLQE